MSIKHLHIIGNEVKFIKPLIHFVNENFDENEHVFLILNSTKIAAVDMSAFSNVKILKPFDNQNSILRKIFLFYKFPASLLTLFIFFFRSKKIHLHGLFDKKIIIFLYFFRNFSKKTYWYLWGGGDIDIPSEIKRKTIWYYIEKVVKGNFKGYVTYLPGDYVLVKKLYNAKGTYHEALMYESNVFKYKAPTNQNVDSVIRILVGNSADCANNHLDIFNELRKHKEKNIKVYCILSYGEKPWSRGWTNKVIDKGYAIFGEKFIPITTFMSICEYNDFLKKIDVAIFAHKRQQGMGNTINLLGLGKKVYIRSDITSWDLFKSLGLNIFDVNHLNLTRLSAEESLENFMIIKSHFSKSKYMQQLNSLYEV
ncbi:TDP-N-acetylfucosamine:lipid II N-acetylfucosaminyltransferase [Shewanella pneumatophori]|uniref:TDP-N-acetylfucosamine:lipid II N-acetylfucosaminyltransferase n=1 Tax=Shewanella pneumatophori TaxID=314092 RepID=A0A9X1ZC78_9GAMM|nr:TDP-N-acetylfucosamine:lipid II N-acetylfucosaminyltransferase [Shewanella pneumatophori]MCL1139589.1 TDP-N-acetylfucosamine:lipid II N-acetylfucosaminyltransferase [Shewanella pneumatophori]